MNLLLSEEETRTIKYLNEPQLQEEGSESLTEKRQGQHTLRNKITLNHRTPLSIDPQSNPKLLALEPLQHPSSHPSRNLANPTKNKHKKGKSAQLDDLNMHSKEERGMKVVIDSHFFNDFRDRASISQMKQYNFSKKLPKKPKDENSTQSKRKKSGTDGNINKIKKEIGWMTDRSPLQVGSKSSSKSSRSNSNNLLGKGGKHKSHELTTDRKPKEKRGKTDSKKGGLNGLKDISQTMPITSKMVSLYSSSSSLFESSTDIQKVFRRQSYVIPTEESMQEITEIRKYESLGLRKRSSENLRKVKLINEISEEEPQQRTQDIISHYLDLLRAHELEMDQQPTELEISSIPHQNSTKERNEELHSDLLISEPPEENGQPLSREIGQQEEELCKLNRIIDIIKQDSGQVDRQQVLQQIKTLISNNLQNSPPPPTLLIHPLPPPLPTLSKQESPGREGKQDLSTSQLKDSVNFEESMEGLNIEILERTLRERENYLRERKDRQLERLEEQPIKDQAWEKQRQRLLKWMDHQIREVVRTRKQLWKGFTMVKGLLHEQAPHQRSTEMMRCLSDKYLAPSRPKKSTELSKGRINEVKQAKDSDTNSEINIPLGPSSEPSDDDQLLESSAKLKNEFQDYKKSIPQQTVKDEHPKSATLKEQPTLMQPPSIGVGLNLQRIECEGEFQESLNSEEIETLARESELAKGESMKMPYELSVQDKEDIFEFIFLDLCIELTDEYPPQSSLMQRICSFIRSMKEQARKQKGFKTSTAAIRDYLFQFITFLKNKPDQLAEVHLNLDKPLGPTALDILKYMHVYEEQPPQEEGSDTVFIMDIKLFEAFEQNFLNALEFEQYYEDEEKEKKRRVFLKNAVHIHNKAVFDALNETLDRQRPFGVWGEPFSWKHSAKFYHTRDAAAKNSLILRAAQRTIQFGAYMCGFMADKEECNLRNNPNVTQAYIEQIRDDRLSRLLANELDESEEKMLFIDDEETQILVQLSQSILHSLLAEAYREFP